MASLDPVAVARALVAGQSVRRVARVAAVTPKQAAALRERYLRAGTAALRLGGASGLQWVGSRARRAGRGLLLALGLGVLGALAVFLVDPDRSLSQLAMKLLMGGLMGAWVLGPLFLLFGLAMPWPLRPGRSALAAVLTTATLLVVLGVATSHDHLGPVLGWLFLATPALLLVSGVYAWKTPEVRLPPTVLAVLQVLQGEPVEEAAARLGEPPEQLTQWVSRFVEAGEAEVMRAEPTRG